MIIAHTEIRSEEAPPWCWCVVSSESLSYWLLQWRFLAAYQVALVNCHNYCIFATNRLTNGRCCQTGLYFCRMKLSQMAADPRNCESLTPWKLKHIQYTLCSYLADSCPNKGIMSQPSHLRIRTKKSHMNFLLVMLPHLCKWTPLLSSWSWSKHCICIGSTKLTTQAVLSWHLQPLHTVYTYHVQ